MPKQDDGDGGAAESKAQCAVATLLSLFWTLGAAAAGTTLVALEDKDDYDHLKFGIGWGLLLLSYVSAYLLTRWRAVLALSAISARDSKLNLADPKDAAYIVHRVKEGLPISVASTLILITVSIVLFIEHRPFDLIVGSAILLGTFVSLLWFIFSRTQYDLGVTKIVVASSFKSLKRLSADESVMGAARRTIAGLGR